MQALFLLPFLTVIAPQDKSSVQEASAPKLPNMEGADPNLWLEDVLGEEALSWVRARNASSTEALAGDPSFIELRDSLRAIYDSDDRIPYVVQRGPY